VPEPIILKNVFFSTNSAELLPKSEPELNLLLEMLVQNNQLKICINGHTDNIGTVDRNLLLSEKRAESVKNYLISKGISSDRLESKGYGETKPIATNQTEEGRQLNRRTEFFIISS
jgi:outer membrane protein OmpA-like peptidoglycan-associated protein